MAASGRSVALWLPLVLAAHTSAHASDGVVEINQTCAVQTGCFSGDSAGFPVTVDGSAGHSYRLSSDLVVPNENTDGIVVSTDDISIDLAGFEIRGPVVCVGSAIVTCTPGSGTGSGVERTSSNISGTSVRDGSIRGMGSNGVLLGVQANVRNLRVRSNRLVGIQAGISSIVSGSSAYLNGTVGINAGAGSGVSASNAYLNGGDGIVADGSTVSGCNSVSNRGDGISAGGSFLQGNAVSVNSGFGLNLGAGTGYRDNVIGFNTIGSVTGGINLGSNVCGSGTCP